MLFFCLLVSWDESWGNIDYERKQAGSIHGDSGKGARARRVRCSRGAGVSGHVRTDGIREQAAGERLTSADTEALVRAVLAEARGQAACSAECVPGEACAPGSEGAQTQKESGPVCAENDVKT